MNAGLWLLLWIVLTVAVIGFIIALARTRPKWRFLSLAIALILVWWAFSKCEAPITKQMREFRKSVKQKVVASDLEQWATNCIAKGAVTEDGASEGIRQLLRESEWAKISEDGTPERVVDLTYGGGFGHWGIAVGSPTYRCRFGNVQTHWTNGIWFWYGD